MDNWLLVALFSVGSWGLSFLLMKLYDNNIKSEFKATAKSIKDTADKVTKDLVAILEEKDKTVNALAQGISSLNSHKVVMEGFSKETAEKLVAIDIEHLNVNGSIRQTNDVLNKHKTSVQDSFTSINNKYEDLRNQLTGCTQHMEMMTRIQEQTTKSLESAIANLNVNKATVLSLDQTNNEINKINQELAKINKFDELKESIVRTDMAKVNNERLTELQAALLDNKNLHTQLEISLKEQLANIKESLIGINSEKSKLELDIINKFNEFKANLDKESIIRFNDLKKAVENIIPNSDTANIVKTAIEEVDALKDETIQESIVKAKQNHEAYIEERKRRRAANHENDPKTLEFHPDQKIKALAQRVQRDLTQKGYKVTLEKIISMVKGS